ncbi:LacI family DNA-binding transcriptional regulator [Sphingomonas aracearum]|uniref:LacI family DNA-binding transcriptional regulator n=1 Tax=Sphingomonas aracearum TaxID=2283317 RepID=A0A369VTG0_9SPHN|nr:LacI family DNA-binding transcriptional regulator [Sphingomonas aracearum]RDE05694.1 LacI family DNA-binding transcriptional regulator [Sphingomonas aracearum]
MSTVTIKDVAARAGVSPKTVSRVINGEEHVRPAVREAVMKVVTELAYRPNAFARGLSSARSFLVGLFFDQPSTGYAADLQRGAIVRCRELSHHLIVEPVDRSLPDWMAKLAATLQELRLAGVILTPPICDWPDLLDLLEEHDVPVVRIAPGQALERTPYVRMDDRAAARELTDHLLGLGHRDIAFIRGNPTHSAAVARWEGFSDAMRAAGIAVPARRVMQGDFSFRTGLAAAEALLGSGDIPTAIFACNDEMALATLVVAMRHGIAVPQQLSITGFDDAEIARIAWPQLTTVRQPNPEMAAAAISMLVGGGGSAPGPIELPYSLVVRDSSGPPPPQATE